MPDCPVPLPDTQALTDGLAAVLGDGAAAGPVTVIARKPNVYASTFPSEVVTCRWPDGSKRRLFCKYGPRSSRNGDRHRGGVAYEAEVYRRLLQPAGAATPRYYGTYAGAAGQVWLVLEYLGGGVRLQKEPAALKLAARWVGHFHAAQARPRSPWLTRYDAAYYTGWARRLSRLGRPWHRRFPWLAPLCERAGEWAALLLAPPLTVIHGEFYPLNVLYRGRAVYPIDWESAAVAAGEIDLASLTESWPARTARECERAYREARWPGGAPADFERRLAAARLYLACRWLADEPGGPADEDDLWYFRQLRSAGRRLGLIGAGRGRAGGVPSR